MNRSTPYALVRVVFVCWLVVLSSSAHAQTGPLTGFRYMRLGLVYMDGRTIAPILQRDRDREIVEHFKNELAEDGWTFPFGPGSDFGTFVAGFDGDRASLSQSLDCTLGLYAGGEWGATPEFACRDALARQMYTFRGEQRGWVVGTGMRHAKTSVGRLAEDIRSNRPSGFSNEGSVDVLTIHAVEQYSLTEGDLENRIASGEQLHNLEGVWVSGPPPAYRLGISRYSDDPNEFVAVVLESPENLLWEPGSVKARISALSAEDVFEINYRSANHIVRSGSAKLGSFTLTFVLRLGDEDLPAEPGGPVAAFDRDGGRDFPGGRLRQYVWSKLYPVALDEGETSPAESASPPLR